MVATPRNYILIQVYLCIIYFFHMYIHTRTDQIEINRNLFTSSTVCFDSTTPPNIQAPHHQHYRGHVPQSGFYCGPPVHYVADTVIFMGKWRHSQPQFHQRRPSPGSTVSPDTMIIAMDDLYIINFLTIKVAQHNCIGEKINDQLLFSDFSVVFM